MDSARALIARGWGVSLVSRCLRVSRAQLHVILRRTDDWKDGRRSRHSDDTDVLLRIHHVIGELPTYGYRRVSGFMGYLKGKSSLMLYEQFGYLKFKYRNRAFWCRGYYVDTVGKNSRIFLNEYKPQMVKQTSPPRISVACIAREHAVVIKTGVIG